MSNEKFTIPTLIKFLQAAPSDDAVPQRQSEHDWVNDSDGPPLGDLISLWRWPPQPKIIDMSYMINNGVDCEFSNEIGWADEEENWKIIGKLHEVNERRGFIDHRDHNWKYCRPRMNEWLAHTGDKCPVPDGFSGHLRMGNGDEINISDMTKAEWGGDHLHYMHRIVHFMITGTAEGYCYPWEDKAALQYLLRD